MMLRNNNKGFTLVEVLLAVVLLGIALIPILQSMSGIYRINRIMVIENTLSFHAQDAIEYAKGSAINASDFSVSQSSSAQLFDGETQYWYTVADDGGTDIDPVPDGLPDVKQITVQAWYGDAGSTYSTAENKIELKIKISKRSS